MPPKKQTFNYVPDGKILTEFFWARNEVDIIQGPFGSGTSTACLHKLWKIALEQEPDSRGVRKSRFLIIRNTFTELKETTLKTWSYWFEEIAQGQFGVLKSTNPPNHLIEWPLPDGTKVRAEFIFVSLDDESDVQKLLSWEYTAAFFNEMQFNDKPIFDAAHGRAMMGRYPPVLDGGPTYKGIIGDMNAPAEGHWVPYMRGDVPLPLEWDDDKRKEFKKPEGWKFHVQPPGLLEVFENGRVDHYELNPAAENQKWIQEPYTTIIKGKPKSWIDSYVMNRVGLYRKGKAVFESFVPETHVSKERLKYNPDWPLIVGVDFARNPAAVIGQLIRGQMYVLDEFGMENVTAGTFAPLLKQRIMKNFPGVLTSAKLDLEQLRARYGEDDRAIEAHLSTFAHNDKIQFFGDPTGGSKGQATDWTPFIIFGAHGMNVIPAPGNNVISIRLEAVETLLNKMVGGSPALLLDPLLRTLKAGMAGAYHFAKKQGAGGQYHETPFKDRFSDYCDAFQYLCLGAGLGFAALNPNGSRPKPTKIKKKKFSLRNRR